MFDAGRILWSEVELEFELHGVAQRPAELLCRVAPEQEGLLRVSDASGELAEAALPRSTEWLEVSLSINAERVGSSMVLRLSTRGPAQTLYHCWLVQEQP